VRRFLTFLRTVAFTLVAIMLAITVAAAFGTTDENGSGPDPNSQSVKAVRALLVEVDRAELCFWKRHGRYSESVAELQENAARVKGARIDGSAIMWRMQGRGLKLELDAGSGRSYIQRVTGLGIDTYVERRGMDFVDFGDLAWPYLKKDCEPDR
jgi:hypothetical protein